MRVSDDHWLIGAGRVPSPNSNARPPGAQIELVVIHGISLPPGEFGGSHVADLFQNRLDPAAHPAFTEAAQLQVSAHLFVSRRGALTQFVPFDERAWHAGVSSWRGRPGCNDFAIGIELEGTDERTYTDSQYRKLAQVLRALLDRYPRLSPEAVVGHCEIAPGRKTDPGPHFDWSRLLGGP